MSETVALLHAQVCYVRPDRQFLLDVAVAQGTTLEQAVVQSGILGMAPEIDLASCKAGIYGKLKTLDTLLREHDRIEIYRPLTADPKDARRRRAGKKQA